MTEHYLESHRDTRRLLVDRSVCAGHGMCYSRSPEVVDCDDAGYPMILRDALGFDEHIAAAEEAVAVCPERALTLASS
ncbi:ferredoxin [Rhodococcus jostii]|uniref:Ferredoxin n=1 Tax=Rhodococcus jostii TaxID=132919 RepID=A0A1H4S2E7_RHOJO|nr:ferredoxin [Rhodococcus jostii]SEC38375.1 ferredoxin [Rhodococcus jostii]